MAAEWIHGRGIPEQVVIVLFPTMGRAEFQLAFDGPALRYGTMDVNELATSLLAVGDLLRNANTVLNEGRSEVSVRVRSDFKKGSFEVALLLNQGIVEHARNLLIPGGSIVAAGTLVKLLFGTEVGKKGVSGANSTVNVLWGLFNLAMGYALVCRVGSFNLRKTQHVLVLGAGILIESLMLARTFGRLHGGL